LWQSPGDNLTNLFVISTVNVNVVDYATVSIGTEAVLVVTIVVISVLVVLLQLLLLLLITITASMIVVRNS
jgi:hypothetical protein